jgi:hypothetical protein
LVDSEPSTFEPGVPVVACLGDSFGVGVVPHHLHYTTLAERELGRVEIYDVAVVNAGPREYLRLLQREALPLAPRLVVVALFLGNDIEDAARPAPSLLASWTDPDEILIRVLPRRLRAVASEREAGGALAREGRADQAFGVPPSRALDAAEIERRLPWLADPLREPPLGSRERFLYVERSRTAFTLPENEPRFEPLFRALEELRAAARPAPIACLLIPDAFQVDDQLWGELRADLPARAERDLPQRTVTRWLDAHDFPYVDLLPRLRAQAPLGDGGLHLFHANDTHFNARGNAVAGHALAELVRRCGVLE